MALQWLLRAGGASQSVHDPTKLKHHLQVPPHGADTQKEMKQCMAQKSTASSQGHTEGFRMPLHYPRYKRGDYMGMEEWRLDALLREYGLAFHGSLEEKRAYAIGTFLWPGQL